MQIRSWVQSCYSTQSRMSRRYLPTRFNPVGEQIISRASRMHIWNIDRQTDARIYHERISRYESFDVPAPIPNVISSYSHRSPVISSDAASGREHTDKKSNSKNRTNHHPCAHIIHTTFAYSSTLISLRWGCDSIFPRVRIYAHVELPHPATPPLWLMLCN